MVVLGWRRLHEAAWPREVTEFTIVLARDLDRAAPRFGFQPLEMLRRFQPGLGRVRRQVYNRVRRTKVGVKLK